MRYPRTNTDARYLPGWSKPPGLDINQDPNHQSADPNGNRAQRRKAKKLGIASTEGESLHDRSV